jgi:clan AA aspartic protease (TIGR02281 family)
MAASVTTVCRHAAVTIIAVSLTTALFQMPLPLYAQAQETTPDSSKLIEWPKPSADILFPRTLPGPTIADLLRQQNYSTVLQQSVDEKAWLLAQPQPSAPPPPDADGSIVPKVVKPTVETRGGEDQESAPERKAPEEHIEHVAMTKILGGVFVVAAEINGMALDFMVDSGAAAVMVPAGVLERMRRDGTVTDADILGPQTFTIADGTRRTWTAFMIRSLKVGSIVVQNIRGGAIESSERITPLLGQSFLERLESWRINNTSRELLLEPRVQLEAAKNPQAWPAVPYRPHGDWDPLPHDAGIRLYNGMRPN